MKKIRLSLGNRSYDIMIGQGLLDRSGVILKGLGIGSDAVIISNAKLSRLYGRRISRSLGKAGLSSHFQIVPDSEKAKSAAVFTRLVTSISEYDRRKDLFIIALGGGVVGDLAGFTAAVYKRGIPYVQIPTTLLAQVDSSIGGKCALDLPAAKNLIGAFYQPKSVISDTGLLSTLSTRQVRTGLAEVIKYGVISDAGLFTYLERNLQKVLGLDGNALQLIVSRSAAIKAAVVEADEFDRTGRRAILNYGHTIGHAIESASGYAGRYNHGEAISVGMVAAYTISVKLGIAKREGLWRVASLIDSAGLPVSARGIDLEKVYESHLRDKKFLKGTNRFVLPVAIGKVRVVRDIPDKVIREALSECAA